MSHAVYGWVLFGTLLIGLLIGAFLLQAVCVLYNKLAGAGETRRRFALHDTNVADSEDAGWPGGVSKLSLGQAMSIVCITAIANTIVGFLIGRVLGGTRMAGSGSLWAISPFAFLIALPASILVMAAMLPTRFGKGLLVALLYTLIWLVLGSLIAALVVAIALARV